MQPQQVAPGDFTDSGESGFVILDRSSKTAYSNVRARQLLYLAAAGARFATDEAHAPILRRVHANLVAIFEDHDAPPPVLEHRNDAGRFVFRAHWLDAETPATTGLVCVTIQHHEPLVVVMMRKMWLAGLSDRQRQVALLLSEGLGFDAIAARLKISRATAKDYAQRLYGKLHVHSREEMLQQFR